LLFTGRIFRGHPSKPYYEAKDGVGFLCYGLLHLYDALSQTKPDPGNPFSLTV
jgi:hypothetical protein